MNQFSILTWNIQGEANITGYTFPKKIRPHLAAATADIIALQECCDPEFLLKETEVLKTYTLLSSPNNGKTEYPYNDNIILTKHQVIETHDIVFPELGQSRPIENALRADIKINGSIVRIYNCHFPIFRAGPVLRIKLLEYIFEDSKNHAGPIIVCGDLNTTIPKPGLGRLIVKTWHQQPDAELILNGNMINTAEHEIIYQTAGKHGFTESIELPHPTWSPIKSKYWQPMKLKLDWIMVKGMNVTSAVLGPYVSDHRPIEAVVRIEN
jgi:endonuclease/exonuclease/phosphatase family metal-dependent hydrolase